MRAHALPLGDISADFRSTSAQGGRPDTTLVAIVTALVAIGVVMIFSASSATAYALHHDTAYFVKRQLMWLVVASIPALIAYRLDYRILRKLGPAFVVLSLFTLVIVMIPHIGLVSGGARRWLGAGAISFQPSEFAKLGLVVYLAAAITRYRDRIQSLSKGLLPLLLVSFVLAGLVLLEPDMGTASLLVFTAFTMLFIAGARVPHLIAVVLVTAPAVIGMIVSSPYKLARIMAFVNPWKDAQNTGFHIVQSLLALGSGGAFGLGLGLSRQKFFYLPEQYTDFIFAIVGEELGLIGALLVVGLFVGFAYRSTKLALAAPDDFGFFLAAGCTALIVIQAFVNIGVTTSSWPVTGVPLPFISFGGSSLIVSLVCAALILNVGRNGRQAR